MKTDFELKQEIAARINAALTRTDVRAEVFSGGEGDEPTFLLYRIDECGEPTDEPNYSIDSHDDFTYSLLYTEMAFDYTKPYQVFGATNDFDEFMKTINNLKFHEDGANDE